MIIAVSTRILRKNKLEGIGNFCYESFRRITVRHPEHEFIFIFDRPYDASFVFSNNVIPMVLPPAARHPLLWYLWYEHSLPRFLKKIKPELFVSPDGYLSTRSDIRSLSVIHDINFEHYPADLPFFYRSYLRYYFPRYARKATRIVTVSEFSKSDIANTYHISKEKIDVVFNGAGTQFIPLPETKQIAVRKKLTDGAPYFLFIGALHQRKNISNLLLAFDAFKKSGDTNMKLVLAGSRRWWTSEMEKVHSSMNFRDAVIFTGRVSDDELAEITGAAFALTYLSTFEGFGIPILEAFRCEIPVLTSNVTSMPEIAADAALLADPFSVESITEGMKKIAFDKQLRNSLIAKGRIRNQDFSWDKTADGLWESMLRTMNT